jgi:hypothetical protein
VRRRDLMKVAGSLALGAPAVRAAALLNSPANPVTQSQTKNLVIAFSGPFCFWQESGDIKVMAPPVGPTNPRVPHQPWIGTTTNETAIRVAPGTTLTLGIDGYTAPASAQLSGTPSFPYEQGQGSGAPPLFNLVVPIPNVIIGVRPTVVKMVCSAGESYPYCTQYTAFASGLSFLYQNVALDGVHIDGLAGFKPCFTNDASLQDATLGVHLTPLDRHPDPDHRHAKQVWAEMLGMYPWIQKEITGIKFCPNFDPASCTFDPSQCADSKNPIQVGPGSDCEVPIMTLAASGSSRNREGK